MTPAAEAKAAGASLPETEPPTPSTPSEPPWSPPEPLALPNVSTPSEPPTPPEPPALALAVGVPPLEMDVPPLAMAAIAAAEAMGIEVGTAKVDAEAAQTAQQQLATRPNVGGPRSCFWSAVADERMERMSGDCGTARAFNLRRALRSLSGLSGEGVRWSGVLARCCLLSRSCANCVMR